MKYKKGDLVKVIQLDENDAEEFGIKEGKTYEVLYLNGDDVYINDGRGNRLMYSDQFEKAKKKSKKDLRIEELENTIEQIQNILNKFKPF